MKMFLLFTFILSFSAHAENSRSPAVLDGTCNTNVPTTMTKVVDGKSVVMERPVADILKDQCKAVKQCMYSANEEDMDQLKSLEAVACNNNLNAVTTKTPGATVDKNFDSKRRSKFRPEEIEQPASSVPTPTTISK